MEGCAAIEGIMSVNYWIVLEALTFLGVIFSNYIYIKIVLIVKLCS